MSEAVIDVYDQMGLSVINVSARELGGDAERFIALTQDRKAAFISANLVVEETGRSVFPGHVVVERGGQRIALIGITQRVLKTWKRPDGSTIAALDPGEVLAAEIDRAGPSADAIILLAHYPRIKLQGLLEGIDGIDLVIGADGHTITREYEEIEGVPICYAGREGMLAGIVHFTTGADGFEILDQSMTRLTPDLPEDETIKKLVGSKIEGIRQQFAEQ